MKVYIVIDYNGQGTRERLIGIFSEDAMEDLIKEFENKWYTIKEYTLDDRLES